MAVEVNHQLVNYGWNTDSEGFIRKNFAMYTPVENNHTKNIELIPKFVLLMETNS